MNGRIGGLIKSLNISIEGKGLLKSDMAKRIVEESTSSTVRQCKAAKAVCVSPISSHH